MAVSQPAVTRPSRAAVLPVAIMAPGGEAIVCEGLQDLAGPTRSVASRSTRTAPGLVAVDGLRARSSNPLLSLPAEPRDCPEAVSQAPTSLRLAGIHGSYMLPLGTDEYRAASETSGHGCPIAAHLDRMPDDAPV
ncbi:encapsulin [Streptomyces sp. NPDC056352]|uniref:encapsulin n=1 Tax=Streptomyces sp. NPDC056352 TaxID=3345791 RepID=UPI0035DA1CD9